MNLRIKLKSNTNVEWFQERLLATHPPLNSRGVIYETPPAGGDISVFVSIDDKEELSFTRDVILISPQILSVSRA